jgi:hypothetical protein
VGQDYIRTIFDGPVEITEKVDGSQFVFARIKGEGYICRSKGKIIPLDYPEKMFQQAVEYITSIEVPEDKVFYCEYLQKPKHNVLAYSRIPKNHLCLFAVSDLSRTKFVMDYSQLLHYAIQLDIDVVPEITAEVRNIDDLHLLLDRESFLGNVNIEGVVVKNYTQPFLLGGQPIPLMAGKFVSEKFKEVHFSKWSKENTGKGKWETYLEGFRTKARWEKAVQHLAEKGELVNSPKDIGSLVKEVESDICSENISEIKDFLFKEFGRDLLRNSVRGLAEWYKDRLATRSFEGD